uniref:Putative secreted protein n=1 Tax=Anopheles darlingi TaxID=43151 RepID=A0A2M4D0G6_ANODA
MKVMQCCFVLMVVVWPFLTSVSVPSVCWYLETAVPFPPATGVAAPKAGLAAPNSPPAVCVFCPKNPEVVVWLVLA